MKISIPQIFSALVLVLAGCTSNSSELHAQKAANIARSEAALEAAQTVRVSGNLFRVAVIDDRSYALVEQTKTKGKYTVADIEVAANSVTGCQATFEPGILALVGGDIETADLNLLRSKVSGRFYGWRTNLSC